MAEGFQIASGFVEIHADTKGLNREVQRSVRDVDVDTDSDRLGNRIGSGIGRGLANNLLSSGGGGGIVSSTVGVMATKFGVAAIAGAGLGTVLTELSGVVGLLPAAGFAGALAIGTLAVATSGFGQAIKDVGDPKKFADDIAKLSPNAREAAVAVRDLMPAFRDLKAAVQDQFFAGLGGMFTGLAQTYLPMVQGAMTSVAGSVNGMIRGVGAEFASTGRQADMRVILDASSAAVGNLLAAVRPLVSAFLDVATVAAPTLASLTAQAGPLAEKFAAFVAKARESGQIGTWIQSGIQAFRDLWTIGGLLFGTVTNLIAAFGGPDTLLGVLTMVAGVLNTVAGFIRDNIAWLGPLATAIGIVSAAVKLWGIIQAATNAIMMLNPFLAIAAAVIAIALLIIMNWDKIKAFLGATWEWIKATASAVWNWITESISGAVTAVRDKIVGTWNDIKASVSGALESIKTTASNAWNSVKDTASSAWSGIKNTVSSAASGARDAASGAWSSVQSNTSSAFNNARSIASTAWSGLLSAIQAGSSNIASTVAALPGRIAGALGNLGGLLTGAGHALIMGLWDGIQSAFNWVKSRVSGLVGSLRNLFPFSPAKEGPFSGKGYTSYSGAALIKDWAKGMTGEAGTVRSALADVMGSVQPSFGLPAPALAGGGAAGGALPSVGGSGSTVNISSLTIQVAGNMDPTNPVAYRQAITDIRDSILAVERSNL